jgi:hypothetical protein
MGMMAVSRSGEEDEEDDESADQRRYLMFELRELGRLSTHTGLPR